MSIKRDPKKEQNETAKAFANAMLTFIAVSALLSIRNPIDISWILYTTLILGTIIVVALYGYDRIGRIIIKLYNHKYGQYILFGFIVLTFCIVMNEMFYLLDNFGRR